MTIDKLQRLSSKIIASYSDINRLLPVITSGFSTPEQFQDGRGDIFEGAAIA
jgi:hypothetical protein